MRRDIGIYIQKRVPDGYPKVKMKQIRGVILLVEEDDATGTVSPVTLVFC